MKLVVEIYCKKKSLWLLNLTKHHPLPPRWSTLGRRRWWPGPIFTEFEAKISQLRLLGIVWINIKVFCSDVYSMFHNGIKSTWWVLTIPFINIIFQERCFLLIYLNFDILDLLGWWLGQMVLYWWWIPCKSVKSHLKQTHGASSIFDVTTKQYACNNIGKSEVYHVPKIHKRTNLWEI